jgi:hypothetical protein
LRERNQALLQCVALVDLSNIVTPVTQINDNDLDTVIPSTVTKLSNNPVSDLAVEGICCLVIPQKQQIPLSANQSGAEADDIAAERGMTVRGLRGFLTVDSARVPQCNE